jgi:hypothetical protein
MLRSLFEANAGRGRDGKEVRDLQKLLDTAQQELADGDAQKATDKLRDLQKKLVEGARDEKLDPAFVEQALAGVAAIGDHYGLPIGPPEEGDRDDGDDD